MGDPRQTAGRDGRTGTQRRDRAVSEVLSYALVFGLIVTSIGIVTVGGLGSLQDARTNEQVANAQRAFDVLHDNLADVHAEGAPSRATEISLGDSQLYLGDNVTMAVKVDGRDAHEFDTIRPVVFQIGDGRSLVYEAGATIQAERDGGYVVNGPPFALTDSPTSDRGQVHVPIVHTTAPSVRSVGGTNVLVRGQSDRQAVLTGTVRGGPDLEYVELQSPRYDIWADYFGEQDYCGSVDVDDGTETVTCHVDGDYADPRQLYVTHQEISLELIT